MADSTITKRALASSLKKLMEEIPFEKIQIAQICEQCEMHRKSFYYHFMDKYDLLNWIFDFEIASSIQVDSHALNSQQRIELLFQAYYYFYENKDFYRKALKVEGQNSFKNHFRECVQTLLKNRIYFPIDDEFDEFELNIFSDVALSLLERWLLDPNCMPPEEMVQRTIRLLKRDDLLLFEK